MVKMIATKPQTYNTKVLKAGEEFDADEQYVGTLISLGRASRADDTKGSKVEPVKTTSTEKKPAETSKYATRRLKADDESK